MNIIATGGVDHMVRLWDSYVTSKPITVMKGRNMAVIDVKLYQPLMQIISYSKDGVSV